MKFFRLLAAACVSLCALAASAQEFAPPRPQPLPAAPPQQARVIVQFKAPASNAARILAAGGVRNLAAEVQALQQRAAALGQRAGVTLADGGGVSERAQVVIASGMASDVLAARLAADPNVEWAVPDRRRRFFAVPNDPLYLAGGSNGPASGQWYLRPPSGEVRSAINAQGAWDITTGSADVVVAVIDTGARFDHPDLAGKLVAGYDFIADPAVANDGNARDADASDPGDWVTEGEATTPGGPFDDCEASRSSWHGTMTAGLVGAATNNGIGMAGTGWNVRVQPVRALGKCFGLDSDIVAAMRWSAGIAVPGVPANPTPARVLNLSLGGEGACTAAYRAAVDEVVAAGRVVVAAAGNSAGHAVSVPANCPGVIGVTGLRHVGTKVGFSDLGPEISISAPGGNCVATSGGCQYPILTTSNAGTTTPVAGSGIYTDALAPSVGTSFAAPLVAGTAALMLSARPDLTPAQVRDAMRSTARPFPGSGVPDDSTGPVRTCVAPTTADQLQCYCTTALCGAGMLDAAAAVAAVAATTARITLSPATPVAGSPLTLSSAGSVLASGRTLVSAQWALVDGGGIVTGFDGPSNGASVTVTPSAPGSFTVRLTVVDDQGTSSTVDRAVSVQAVAAPAAGADGAGGGSSGGGGATSGLALLGLLAASAALARQRENRTR